MALKLSNNGVSRLSGSITSTSTTANLQPGEGILFPELGAGDWFPLTLVKTGAFEIVRVSARSGDTLTIDRAQEGTLATSFSAGDRVELRMTALAYQSFVPDLTWSSISGKPSFAVVATSGSYNDLLDKPVAPTYSTVASSGQYNDLLGKPTLGTAAAKAFGVAAGNLVEVQTGGKLPALDGSNLTGISIIPIGTVMHIAASSAPSGFLASNAIYAIASYPALAAVLGSQPNGIAITQPAKTMTGLTTASDAAYGAGRWIAVGTSNQSSYSDDGGLTWTSRAIGAGAYGIAYGGGRWVAVGNGISRYSTDGGVNWTSGGSGGWLANIAYNNGMFVAYNIFSYIVASSPDGAAWTNRVSVGGGTSIIGTVGNGFVAAGTGFYYSADGITWALRNSLSWAAVAGSPTGVLVGIVTLDPNGDGTFENYMQRSTDLGVTWQDISDAPSTAGSLSYSNGLFYLYTTLATTTVIYTSADGIRWKKNTIPLSPAPASNLPKFSNGKILAISGSTAYPMSDITYNPATNFYVPNYDDVNPDIGTRAYIRAS